MANHIFGTDGVRGKANTYPINVDFSIKLAKVLSETICTNYKKVIIGKDTRISGDMIESALCAGFTSCGISVELLGIVPTPLVSNVTASLNVDLAIMITASHNPYTDNGIKLLDHNGDKLTDEVYAKIEKLLYNNYNMDIQPNSLGRITHNTNAIQNYIETMRNIVASNTAFKDLRIVVDCANGAYFNIFPKVLKDLGAGVIVINNKPNGENINLNCGSQNTKELSQVVIDTNANFGIAIDGDGDRIILIDDKGIEVDGDQLLCLLAKYLKNSNMLNKNTVISTEWSNLGLGEYFKTQNINHFKSKVGERYVVEMMKETKASLGGELVGHIVIDKYAKSGDSLACAIILSLAYIQENKKMSEIFPIFKPYPCIITNIRFNDNEVMRNSVEFDDVKEALILAKEKLGTKSNVIARKSGTEPVIKLRIEGENQKLVEEITEELKNLIENHKD